jgi:hypothetical protein
MPVASPASFSQQATIPTKEIQEHLPAYRSKWRHNLQGKPPWRDKISVKTVPVKAPSLLRTTTMLLVTDSALPLTRKTIDNPKKHTEDLSTDAEEINEEKIIGAKPPAEDTVTMVLPPTDHHRNLLTIDIADAGEARERLQP